MAAEPKVSILIPTLNSASVLEDCLKSIFQQKYLKDQIEIIISDGGSNDGTLGIAERYGCIVVENPLKTGEAGKMSAFRRASGKYITLIDSDNILPYDTWLKDMIEPLEQNPKVVGSEPWEYTWRREDGFITRYCALMGLNDPLCYFLGNYDRINLLSGAWTKIHHNETDQGNYLIAVFNKSGRLPTIGANGTVFRSDFLKENVEGDYLFDIDILSKYLQKCGRVEFIKVKNGIVHTYCENDIGKFARKQRRRVSDFMYHKKHGDRSYSWESGGNIFGLSMFILSCTLVLPLIYQSLMGYSRKKDLAWFFHPLACYITLWEYTLGVITGIFRNRQTSRENWSQ